MQQIIFTDSWPGPTDATQVNEFYLLLTLFCNFRMALTLEQTKQMIFSLCILQNLASSAKYGLQ